MGEIRVDGDTWSMTSSDHDPRHEVQTVVFHCVSNPQRPYRVVEVPDALLARESVADLSDGELQTLFERTQVMDFSHEHPPTDTRVD